MGKKITSSSPLDTIAFDAIPNTWTYANAFTAIKGPDVTSAGGSSGTSGDQGYYRSTRGNSGFEATTPGCPIGKHMDENGICVKNKKRSRGERLTDKIREDEAMGKTASAARRRKSLAGWELSQEKRKKQIESGKTFFGRFFSDTKDLFDKGAHTGEYEDKTIIGDKKGKAKIAENYVHGFGVLPTSRHDLKIKGAKDIKTREKTRTDCINNSKKKWENGVCVDKPGTNTPPVNNPVGVPQPGGSINNPGTGVGTKYSTATGAAVGCPKGMRRHRGNCI